ncbi:SAM-dependent methyltransferase [Paenibacillus sp. 7884-2]|nr:SAM-dependent methyltransferase [Paenibacillus sp. 7884-2]
MELDNFQEYEDPILYDTENESYLSDLVFLKKWAVKTEGTLIDLACGTGRATIPLAQDGHQLIGVDIHQQMLHQAKKKAVNLSITWVEQDCTTLDLKLQSPFIYMVGNSFQHFLTNEAQNMLLQSVNHHLDKNGVFIFNARFPNSEELLSSSTEEYWKSYIDNGEKVDVYTISEYDALLQIQHNVTIRKYPHGKQLHTSIRLRYVFPKEMERLLAENGFEILHVYGDWKEGPLTNESMEMIYVCRKKK